MAFRVESQKNVYRSIFLIGNLSHSPEVPVLLSDDFVPFFILRNNLITPMNDIFYTFCSIITQMVYLHIILMPKRKLQCTLCYVSIKIAPQVLLYYITLHTNQEEKVNEIKKNSTLINFIPFSFYQRENLLIRMNRNASSLESTRECL